MLPCAGFWRLHSHDQVSTFVHASFLRSRLVVPFASMPSGGGAPRVRRFTPTMRPPSLAGLEIAAAEEKLLIASVAPEAAESGPFGASASVPEQNREKPLEAGSCTGASHIPFLGAGACSSSISPAGSSIAVYPVSDAADGTPTMPGIPRAAAHGDADADADADADVDADAMLMLMLMLLLLLLLLLFLLAAMQPHTSSSASACGKKNRAAQYD
eukprot:2194105-Pleurochrysis_carterae.AAC.2